MGGGQNTYNPLKNKGRNKKIITIIIFLVLIVVSISFALFNPSINLLGRRNIKISKCELDINFKESDELMLVSKYPISTRQALEGDYKPKKVTITNNSTCDTAYYKLTIKDLINSSINKDVIQYHVVDKQNTMTYKLGDINNDNDVNERDYTQVLRYIANNNSKFGTIATARYAADVNGDGMVNDMDQDFFIQYFNHSITTFPAGTPLEEKTTTKEIINVNPDTFLIENSIEKGQTHEYEIIMWISNTATNTDLYENGDTTKPIEYKYALNIEASDEKKEDAEIVPILNIPVGTNGIEKVTHEIDNTLQVDSRFATEYRYRGGSVNNYVTFNNKTWRIIGIIPTEDTDGNVENRIKIINATSVDTESWGSDGQYDWSDATLNQYLNNEYYDTLSEEAKSMIGTTKYYLGIDPSSTVSETWKSERSTIDYYFTSYEGGYISKNHLNKIGLIYASDYIYAGDKSCDNLLVFYNDDFTKTTSACKDNNWIHKFMGNYELIITQPFNGQVWLATGEGAMAQTLSPLYTQHPVLTLSSNVKISSGTGTSSDPYKLQLD